MTTNSPQNRDTYVDLLRSLGLMLLIGVHVSAPDWYVKVRSFDVPLMIMVSAMCYKPQSGGYFCYATKRFRRIYAPVALFLTLFFLGAYLFDIESIGLNEVLGSYLLLDWPSIGYVWVMRVFLTMALIIPLLHRLLSGLSYFAYLMAISTTIAVQQLLVPIVDAIPNRFISFAVYEILLFTVGYSALAAVGLRIARLTQVQLITLASIAAIAIIAYVVVFGTFNPQDYKYPPHSLYIAYGIFVPAVLMLAKPWLVPIARHSIIEYLSRNSMWIYLWHIVPVFALERIHVCGLWLGRYILVVAIAIIFTHLYHCIIRSLPQNLRQVID